MHQTMFESIKHHQYCNRSQSIQTWTIHFNEERKAQYEKIAKSAGVDAKSLELHYQTVLRYFYFYSLLCRIQEIEKGKWKPIIINKTKSINIALIITQADKDNIRKAINILPSDTDKDIRARSHFVEYFIMKYWDRLEKSAVSELQTVPVRYNVKTGEYDIHPGWFVM